MDFETLLTGADLNGRSYREIRSDVARLSQQELATRADVSRPTLHKWESGETVSPQTREKLRRALAAAIMERRRAGGMADEHEDAFRELVWLGVKTYFNRLDELVENEEMDGDAAALTLYRLLQGMNLEPK